MRLLLLVMLMMNTLSLKAQAKDETAIRKMLSAQVNAWNRGSIEGYMLGYWEHDSLLFTGKNGPTYGYKETLARYKNNYPDKAAMGLLTSTVVSMKRLSKKYYFIVGTWKLDREGGELGGSFTLLLQKRAGEWVIVANHSS